MSKGQGAAGSNDTMLHDSLLVALGAAALQANLASTRPVDADALGRIVLEAALAIEAADEYREDVLMLSEVQAQLDAFAEMREKGQRREIASLAMMTVQGIAKARSSTLRTESLRFILEMAGVSPAGVNNEHVLMVCSTFEKFRDLLAKSVEAGPEKASFSAAIAALKAGG